MNQSVYLISSTSGHYKIGHSSNPKRRLVELQKTAGPYEYALEYYWVCGSNSEAAALEGYLHKVFRSSRVNGEWFVLYPQDLVVIGGICADRGYMFGGAEIVV